MNRYSLALVLSCYLAFAAGAHFLEPAAATDEANRAGQGMASIIKPKLDQPGVNNRVFVKFTMTDSKGPAVLYPDENGEYEVKNVGPDWIHVAERGGPDTYYIIPFSQLIVHRDGD